MPRFQVRYHRSILDSGGRVLYPSGAIIDRLDMIPPGQEDRVLVIPDGVPQVGATVTIRPAPDEDDEDEDEEC
jgi:hypothetical protein